MTILARPPFPIVAGTTSSECYAQQELETSQGSVPVKWRLGQGAPFLLVSIGIEDARDKVFASSFRRRYSFVEPDLSFCFDGIASEDLVSEDILLRYADGVIEVAEMLGLNCPVVLGLGKGASIAVSIAASWPETRALLLVGEDVSRSLKPSWFPLKLPVACITHQPNNSTTWCLHRNDSLIDTSMYKQGSGDQPASEADCCSAIIDNFLCDLDFQRQESKIYLSLCG